MSLVASLFYPGLSWLMGSLSPHPAHCTCTQRFHLFPSLSLRDLLPQSALATTGEEGWALGLPSCERTLHRYHLPQGLTYCHLQRRKHEMTKSCAILTTPPVQTCPRHTFSQRCFLCVSHAPQTPVTMQVTSHRHPVVMVWPAFPHCLSSCHTHTFWHRTCSLTSKLTGEGGIQPGQSAHIGSPELPCHTESLTIAPPPATLPPTPACQTHAQPCSHCRRMVGRCLSLSVVVGGVYHKPLRALHSPARFPSL